MAPPRLSRRAFGDATGFSRETLDMLQVYGELLVKWQNRLNLVGAGTLHDLWSRHMLDSAQLWPLMDADAARITDLGSGAGFPGLVLAIMAGSDGPALQLIESDARKCAFLETVIRATGANARVVRARIETNPVPPAPIVTARACAPLNKLLSYTAPLLEKGGVALFLKGRSVEQELTVARRHWTMTVVRHQSQSDPSGTILELRRIRRVDEG